MTQTKLNFTGQKKDSTGLLYYHARMYDLALGTFVSSDAGEPPSTWVRTRSDHYYLLRLTEKDYQVLAEGSRTLLTKLFDWR